MIDRFSTLAAAVELNGAVYLHDDTGILKCTGTHFDQLMCVVFIREDAYNGMWHTFDRVKDNISILEDQGAAQALWELANG